MSKFKRLTFWLSLLGLTVFGIGFFYEVIYAGIPYQDPTPAMEEKYNYHSYVGSSIQTYGIIIFIAFYAIGKIIKVVEALQRKNEKGNS